MSATRTVPTARGASTPGTAAPVPAPAPRRVRPPRWLDLRLVLGVLLVLGSVLLGARVVAAADATVPVWSAAGDLAAGTVLTAGDLVAVDVRLDDVAGAYLATSTRPEGRTLARAVRSGELLPRTALEEPAELVQLALPVQAGYVPPGLDRGQVVDVYAVADPAAGATGAGDGSVALVVAAAPVQAISGRTEGVLSTATTTVQVVVSVPADQAPAVLGAIGGRPLVVVVHGSVDGAGGAASGPATAAPSVTPSTSRSTPSTSGSSPSISAPAPSTAAPSAAAVIPPAAAPARSAPPAAGAAGPTPGAAPPSVEPSAVPPSRQGTQAPSVPAAGTP
ncbi:Chaperone for flagella basal body P-ring formation [Geodermatophilus siccatus]|uniref:Chaperone for flagella basal body P-ring formation n=1 Tax=Geodermatophilus siccatus TaxID=1137991 RepID=A0A1G9LAC7_9ACTN|nr:SAF domain-containing protein [Geodermatophilus siccatus]SDL58834.1 Chaperone for flagella basal body P-ring formation [Geodermatophilus siccatus]